MDELTAPEMQRVFGEEEFYNLLSIAVVQMVK